MNKQVVGHVKSPCEKLRRRLDRKLIQLLNQMMNGGTRVVSGRIVWGIRVEQFLSIPNGVCLPAFKQLIHVKAILFIWRAQ